MAQSALQRAQALAAQAESDGGTSVTSIARTLEARTQAAAAYESAASETTDSGARGALHLLATKQRQLAAEDRRRLEKAKATPSRALGGRNGMGPGLQRRPRDVSSPTASFISSTGRRLAAPALDASRISEAPTSASTMLNGSRGEASMMPDNESSFMLLRGAQDSSDPFRNFEYAIEGMLAQLSRPVAFASAPIASTSSKARTQVVKPAAPPPRPVSPDLAESFCVVPSPNSPAASTKTVEELTIENASLKTHLDALTAERGKVAESIADLRQGLRAASHQVSASMVLPRRPDDSDKRIAELMAELEIERDKRLQAEASAVKNKTRYDKLKDAITKKRAQREAAERAAAQGNAEPAT